MIQMTAVINREHPDAIMQNPNIHKFDIRDIFFSYHHCLFIPYLAHGLLIFNDSYVDHTMNVITYVCRNPSLYMLIKGAQICMASQK